MAELPKVRHMTRFMRDTCPDSSHSGEGGIRTRDGLAPMPVFKTGAFNRSATSPEGCADASGPFRSGPATDSATSHAGSIAGVSVSGRIAFECYGVPAVAVRHGTWEPADLAGIVPPHSRMLDDPPPGAREFQFAGIQQTAAEIRHHIAENAPEHVFVHAGVVAVAGGAIVLPGFTWSGKTTLVAALLRAGADYVSDEYAVIGADGRVHPFGKPLSIRDGTGTASLVPASRFGADTVTVPIKAALVVATAYRPDCPTPLTVGSLGSAVIFVLQHTVPARTRPSQALAAAAALVAEATLLVGLRGEADAATLEILAALDQQDQTVAA
jgi:hypothetical protein